MLQKSQVAKRASHQKYLFFESTSNLSGEPQRVLVFGSSKIVPAKMAVAGALQND
jgi:hypothetical protein